MHRKKRVLVVDDNPVNLSILEEMLSDDYNVRFASDGAEAIRLATRFQPAIVLLDVMMPGIDGLEVCRRIRATSGPTPPVIIMISAKAMPSEQAAGMRAGADEYLTKPFDELELHEAMRRFEDMHSAGNGGCSKETDDDAILAI